MSAAPADDRAASAKQGSTRVLGGRYRLDAELGRGGMGVVYRGVDLHMERPVAVKLLRFEGDDEDGAAQRFLREVKNAARVQHEHIVQVFDFGRSDEGDPFLVMELLGGAPLSRLLREERRLPPPRAVDIASQICEALAAAHEGGLVHRDLKPANVMLLSRGERGDFVKLIDFGVAKAVDRATVQTKPGELLGTLGYMAPEQIQGVEVDARADLYAAGVLIYLMLTGTAVFEDHGIAAMIHDHLQSAPVAPSERAKDLAIPRALDAAVLRCLCKRPEDRFGSARELGEALRRSMMSGAGEPVAVAVSKAPVPDDAPLPDLPEAPDAQPLIDIRLPDDLQIDPTFELAEIPLPRSTASLSGPRRCPTCGADNARYARVCSRCAGSLDGVDPVSALDPSAALALRPADPLATGPETPLDRALSPFTRYPSTVWKRVAGFSAAALGVWAIFFAASSSPILTIVLTFVLAVGVLGVVGSWRRHR